LRVAPPLGHAISCRRFDHSLVRPDNRFNIYIMPPLRCLQLRHSSNTGCSLSSLHTRLKATPPGSFGRPDQHQSRVLLTHALKTSHRESFYTRSQSPFPFFARHRNEIIPAMATKTQTRTHAGHHHHHHDNTYLTSTNKNDAGVRITRIGLYSNLGMAIAKGFGGYAFNSQAMVADAWVRNAP
jgi:hypothetical protein